LLGLLLLLGARFFGELPPPDVAQTVRDVLASPEFWGAVGIGLLAQTVDGALGMAYGVTASSFLLAMGASPAMASGATHLAEVFTTGVSGIAHQRLGNVDKRLFVNLVIPGVLGGVLGAVLLTHIDGTILKPFVSAYLLLMGLYVISKAVRKTLLVKDLSGPRVRSIALVGGFFDSTGGGGWGPIVTTSLVGAGQDPKATIGSVNYAEFFLTLAVSAALFSVLDNTVWVLVAGLILGGVLAAPLAAMATRTLQTRTLLFLVGGLITSISLLNVASAL
jgi:uncharacterized membrane protein YfcA